MPAKTPKRTNLPAKPPGGSNFPDDEFIARIGRGIAATFGSPLMELVQKLGLSVEDTIRFHLVSKKCREERERVGLSIKDAARRLSVPQYRIRALESVEIRNVAPTVLRNYLDLLGLSDWYSEWAHANAELARRLESGNANGGHHPAAPDTQAIPAPIPGITQFQSSRRQAEEAISFRGQVIAVKARIRLIRSFDQISHQYQGYTLVLAGLNPEPGVLRVAIGPASHAKHQFRIGDVISGKHSRCQTRDRNGPLCIRPAVSRLKAGVQPSRLVRQIRPAALLRLSKSIASTAIAGLIRTPVRPSAPSVHGA
jgi:transcriptional regulator with XRE-family HTH domain